MLVFTDRDKPDSYELQTGNFREGIHGFPLELIAPVGVNIALEILRLVEGDGFRAEVDDKVFPLAGIQTRRCKDSLCVRCGDTAFTRAKPRLALLDHLRPDFHSASFP